MKTSLFIRLACAILLAHASDTALQNHNYPLCAYLILAAFACVMLFGFGIADVVADSTPKGVTS